MNRLLMAGLGGFMGSALRFGIGSWIARAKGGTAFPWETLAINVCGCLLIGGLAALAETRGLFPGASRTFVFVGILGGFTTFSAFGYETFHLLRAGHQAAAAASVVMQIVLGLAAVWAGDSIARSVWSG